MRICFTHPSGACFSSLPASSFHFSKFLYHLINTQTIFTFPELVLTYYLQHFFISIISLEPCLVSSCYDHISSSSFFQNDTDLLRLDQLFYKASSYLLDCLCLCVIQFVFLFSIIPLIGSYIQSSPTQQEFLKGIKP